ncbi:MAG: hypothetical protein AB1757_24235 [Acidobacteriota bacterium]
MIVLMCLPVLKTGIRKALMTSGAKVSISAKMRARSDADIKVGDTLCIKQAVYLSDVERRFRCVCMNQREQFAIGIQTISVIWGRASRVL